MTNKQRVYAAIRGQNPDRVPRYVWVGGPLRKRLLEHFGGEQALFEFLDDDIFQTWLSINREMERPAGEGDVFTDEWGIDWKREGAYNMVIRHPMAALDAGEIAAYKLPDPLESARYAPFLELMARHGGTHFIGADVSGSIFEPAYHLRGMENLMIDMMDDGDEINILFDRLLAFSTEVSLRAAALHADWIWLGDDVGTQRGMIISPDLWRRHLKPRMAALVKAIRAKKPDMIIAYHSCGGIFPIIGDLIEIGINVLNPLQQGAQGMDHARIKAEFGGAITMMCGLDTQAFLPMASADKVYDETRRLLDKLARGGGFIFGASHTMQGDIPLENVLAMYRALEEG